MPIDPLAWREYTDHTVEQARANREDRGFDAATRVRLFTAERVRVERAREMATSSAASANAVRLFPAKAPVDDKGRRRRCEPLGLYSVPRFDHLTVFECVISRRADALCLSDCIYHCTSEEFADAPAERHFFLSDDGEALIGWEDEAPDIASPTRVAFLLVNLRLPSSIKVLRQRIKVADVDGPLPQRLLDLLWIE